VVGRDVKEFTSRTRHVTPELVDEGGTRRPVLKRRDGVVVCRAGELGAALGEVSYVLAETLPRLLSYGPPWAHYLGGYQDRLLGGPLGLPGLRYTTPEGVEHKDYTGVVLG
jgi:hypothetical protein